MPKDVILTREGLEKLKHELEELSTVKRREVAERIKEAREFGDISENAEYEFAKNEQAMLETRIAQLEDRIRAARVVDPGEVDTSKVQVGNTVHVTDEDTGKALQYTIVGSAEADLAHGRLSNESPVGKALLGATKGDVVAVSLPRGGQKHFKVTKIELGI